MRPTPNRFRCGVADKADPVEDMRRAIRRMLTSDPSDGLRRQFAYQETLRQMAREQLRRMNGPIPISLARAGGCQKRNNNPEPEE